MKREHLWGGAESELTHSAAGSVIVDLAAETGGNCELTQPGEKIVYNGVTIIGYTVSSLLSECSASVALINVQDLPSRLPTQSSTLYSNNITKFLLSIGDAGRFNINLEDEVVRRSIITHEGDVLWPAPSAAPPQTPVQSGPKPVSLLRQPASGSVSRDQAAKEEKPEVEITPWRKAVNNAALTSGGMATALALGKVTGPAFMNLTTTLGLAGLVGFRAVWNVAPALHSPLMCECPFPPVGPLWTLTLTRQPSPMRSLAWSE